MEIGTNISIITLNVNGLSAPTKRNILAKWIQKQDPYICCLENTHFWEAKESSSSNPHIRENRP